MAATSAQGSTVAQGEMQIVFVNPGYRTKDEDVTLIRSHASQFSHNRLQQRRRNQLAIRHYRAKSKSIGHPAKDARPAGQGMFITGDNGLTRLQAQQDAHSAAPCQRRPEYCFSPTSFINYTRINPFQSYARVVSDLEHFLIDHCKLYNAFAGGGDITHIVSYDYPECLTGNDRQTFMQETRSCWVPWTLSDYTLMAGIFMAACRSLLELHPKTAVYRMYYLYYKAECFQAIQSTISSKGFVSDGTIALAVLLSAEEFMHGNMSEGRVHSQGVVKMVNMRGGRQEVGGPGNFLDRLLSKYVYNPMLSNTDSPAEKSGDN